MTGTTHVPAGVAASLAILRPTTVTGIAAAVAGGAIGGWICDIDVRERLVDQEHRKALILMAVIAIAAVTVDYLHGGGICDYWVQHWSTEKLVMILSLAAYIVIGVRSHHRSFTHSFVGIAWSTALVWNMFQPLAPAYAIGYASHMALDLLNRRGEALLWPIHKRFCLDLCDSDGAVNRIVGRACGAVAFCLGVGLTYIAVQPYMTWFVVPGMR